MIDRSSYWDDPAVSQSDLKLVEKSVHHYYETRVRRSVPGKDSRALRVGRALHALVFEPETFDARFPVFEGDLKTKAAREEYAKLDEDASALDGCVIREKDAAPLFAMRDALCSNENFARMLALVTHAELPIAWTVDGVACKGRLDAAARLDDHLLVIDLKTTREVPSKREIEKVIANLGYHKQAAHYCDGAAQHFGVPVDDYYLVFVESEPPHAVALYALDEDALDVGRRWRAAMLARLTEARETNDWRFQREPEVIGLAPWAQREW